MLILSVLNLVKCEKIYKIVVTFEILFFNDLMIKVPSEKVHWKYNHKFVKRFNLLTNTVSLYYVSGWPKDFWKFSPGFLNFFQVFIIFRIPSRFFQIFFQVFESTSFFDHF